jgi:hypothetical protein
MPCHGMMIDQSNALLQVHRERPRMEYSFGDEIPVPLHTLHQNPNVFTNGFLSGERSCLRTAPFNAAFAAFSSWQLVPQCFWFAQFS